MEQPKLPNAGIFMEQQKLPNTGVIIGLGIASILLCWCYGVLGLILSIVAIILASKSKSVYNESPQDYSDYGTLTTGKVIAIIGLILNILFILLMIWMIVTLGWDVIQSGDEELVRERMEELLGE